MKPTICYRLKSFATGALVILCFLTGCASHSELTRRMAAPGWTMLPFPRASLTPGTVFTSDAENGFLIYGTYASSNDWIMEAASLPSIQMSLQREADANAVLSFLTFGATGAGGVSGNATSQVSVSFKATGAQCYRLKNLFDSLPPINKAIIPKLARSNLRQKFYVVVEAVAVSQMDYSFNDEAVKRIGGEATFDQIAKANALMASRFSQKGSIRDQFVPPQFVFFHAKRLDLARAAIGGNGKLTPTDLEDDELPILLKIRTR